MSVAFSPDSQLVASASMDETGLIHDMSDGALMRTIKVGAAPVAFCEGLCENPTLGTLVRKSGGGRERRWVVTGEREPRLRHATCLTVPLAPAPTLISLAVLIGPNSWLALIRCGFGVASTHGL